MIPLGSVMNTQDIDAELALIEMLRFRNTCIRCGPRKPDWDYNGGTFTCVRCKAQFNIVSASQAQQWEACGQTFQAQTGARYCSPACQQRAYRRRVLDANSAGSLPGSPSGKRDQSAILLPFPRLF